MDARLAIASKRDARRYGPAPLPADSVGRILDAGRLAGSARNRQPWRFVLVEGNGPRAELAETVHAPENVNAAALVVAVVGSGKGPIGFDCGRASQNMMLAAWDEGIVSSPNGVADQDRAAEILGLGEEDRLQIVLTFGYPVRKPAAESRTYEAWSARADRRPLEETVSRL